MGDAGAGVGCVVRWELRLSLSKQAGCATMVLAECAQAAESLLQQVQGPGWGKERPGPDCPVVAVRGSCPQRWQWGCVPVASDASFSLSRRGYRVTSSSHPAACGTLSCIYNTFRAPTLWISRLR